MASFHPSVYSTIATTPRVQQRESLLPQQAESRPRATEEVPVVDSFHKSGAEYALVEAEQHIYPQVSWSPLDERIGSSYKLTDVLASPWKHALANALLLSGGGSALFLIAATIQSSKHINTSTFFTHALPVAVGLAIPAFVLDYMNQHWVNTHIEPSVRTLGAKATFTDLKAYQAQHPASS
jgi:hypothetical protein